MALIHLENPPSEPFARLLLAHGAGAGAQTAFLRSMAQLLADQGLACLRFEFAYMAARSAGGSRKPPPRAERLRDEYRAAAAEVPPGPPLLIGGKSMGGRVASMVADELYQAGRIAALVCLGYPFHPPNKPEQLRTAHLINLQCPTLIVQGERDPFGPRQEVEAMRLSSAIRFHWISDGDHDFGPRGGSGFTRKGNLANAAEAVAAFARDIGSGS